MKSSPVINFLDTQSGGRKEIIVSNPNRNRGGGSVGVGWGRGRFTGSGGDTSPVISGMSPAPAGWANAVLDLGTTVDLLAVTTVQVFHQISQIYQMNSGLP